VRILQRADSGFARAALMAWCEANLVDYLRSRSKECGLAQICCPKLADVQKLGH
jgi:hypothetical protein